MPRHDLVPGVESWPNYKSSRGRWPALEIRSRFSAAGFTLSPKVTRRSDCITAKPQTRISAKTCWVLEVNLRAPVPPMPSE
jgi:hypothetical protein